MWCCAPFAQLSRTYNAHNFREISKCVPTFVLCKTQIFLHRFTANITSCLQACSVVFCLLWCCALFAQLSRTYNAHNFHEISKCLPTFVLRKTQTFLNRFTANITSCLQACRVVFCRLWCCAPFAQLSRTYNAHNFIEISKCLQTFVLRKTQTFLHRFTANITSCLQACRVVFCLLWCCVFFAQLSRTYNAHNFREISKCLPTFVLRKTQTFLHRLTINITSFLQACRVVFCLLWCCAPFAQLSRANNEHNFHEISKCLQTFVLRKTQTFLHRFTANITSCLQACRVVFCFLCCCALFAQLSRTYNAHNFSEISKCLPTFVLRKTQTFLHRFTANITSCLQACRVVFCLLWCCAPFAQLSRTYNAHNFRESSKCLPTFVLRKTQTFLQRFTANITSCLQACRVVICLLWCCAPFAHFSRANNEHNFQSVYPLLYYAKLKHFCTGLRQT